MKKTIVLAIMIFLWRQNAIAEKKQNPSCDLAVPFEFPVESSVAEVSSLHFIASFPSSSGEFWFTNRAKQPIVSVLAVVELRDRHGQHMFDMLFHAFEFKGYARDNSPSSLGREAQEAIQLSKPVLPGEKTLWGMRSPFFVTHCPTSAHATFFQIQFRNSPMVEHFDPEARRDPVILDASTIDLTNSPFTVPFEALATLDIDTQGRASLADVGKASNEFKAWLGSRMRDWQFAPAYFGNIAVPGKLLILFRFHKETPQQYPALGEFHGADAFAVADVFPPEDSKPFWRVYVGLSTLSIRGIPDI